MKKDWSVGDLIDHFTLTSGDLDWLSGQATYNQLGGQFGIRAKASHAYIKLPQQGLVRMESCQSFGSYQ